MIEYSHYYFIGSDGVERFKRTTTLNNKGDNFYHSVYIHSEYFDQIEPIELDEVASNPDQLMLPSFGRTNKIFTGLRAAIDRYLRTKRKPFLRKYTDRLIEEYEADDAFPPHSEKWFGI